MTKNKKPKRKLAMRMLTREEIKQHISIFLSDAWVSRSKIKLKKEMKRNKNIK